MSYVHYARAAHDAMGQRRKYTLEPYWVHPERVANLVESWGGDESSIAAAWLHDVVEDTHITVGQINNVFGSEIAGLVLALTDFKEGSNSAQRKEAYRNRMANASTAAQVIKAADIYDNVSDVVKFDVEFARMYIPEKRALFQALEKLPWAIYDILDNQLQKAEEQL